MKSLIILNDAPYGSERVYNGLRLALSLNKHDPDGEITLFLMADAVTSARREQKTPAGYYNIEHMLKRLAVGRNRILLCSTCMDARGLTDDDLMAAARRSSMGELSEATLKADKVLVF